MNTTYIVIFEFGSGADIFGFEEKIKSFNGWAQIASGAWAVGSGKRREVEIRNSLLPFLGEGGRLFVIQSGRSAAWYNLVGRSEWFKQNL